MFRRGNPGSFEPDWSMARLYNNYLTFNPHKIKLMLFKSSPRTNHGPLVVEVNQATIKRVLNTKYLGLIINEELKWKHHIKHLRNTLCPYLFVLRRSRYSLPPQTKLALYYSYVHSHLSHLVSIWGYTIEELLNQLQVIQNKAIRSLCWQEYRSVCCYRHIISQTSGNCRNRQYGSNT